MSLKEFNEILQKKSEVNPGIRRKIVWSKSFKWYETTANVELGSVENPGNPAQKIPPQKHEKIIQTLDGQTENV